MQELFRDIREIKTRGFEQIKQIKTEIKKTSCYKLAALFLSRIKIASLVLFVIFTVLPVRKNVKNLVVFVIITIIIIAVILIVIKKKSRFANFTIPEIKTVIQEPLVLNKPISTKIPELPKSIEDPIRLDYNVKQVKKPDGELVFLLGKDDNGLVFGDLAELLSCLIAGLPGKGKSNFINQFLQSMMLYNNNVVYIMYDFKIVELSDYSKFNNTYVINKPAELLQVLQKLKTIMDQRYDMFTSKPGRSYKKIQTWNKNNPPIPWIVLLIDEISDINELHQDIKVPIWALLKELLRKARAAGMPVLIATQRPTTDNIPGTVTAYCGTKMIFGVNSKRESYYCGVENAENLIKGKYVIKGEGEQFNNTLLESFLVDENDQIYYILQKTLEQSNEKSDPKENFGLQVPATSNEVLRLISELKDKNLETQNFEQNNEDVSRTTLVEFINFIDKNRIGNELPSVKLIKEELNMTDRMIKDYKKEMHLKGLLKKLLKKYEINEQNWSKMI